MIRMHNLLHDLKSNLVLEHDEDDLLLRGYLTAAIDYAESYQHREPEYYDTNAMSASTRQAVLLLASHFYESRDGSTAGFFGDGVEAGRNVWKTVNTLLDMGKEWVV